MPIVGQAVFDSAPPNQARSRRRRDGKWESPYPQNWPPLHDVTMEWIVRKMKALLPVLILTGVMSVHAGAQDADWPNQLFREPYKDFGPVKRGQVVKHSFKASNPFAVPVAITSIRTSCGCLTATAKKKNLKPGHSGKIDVVLDSRRFTGPKTITIYVELGGMVPAEARLRVSANSVP